MQLSSKTEGVIEENFLCCYLLLLSRTNYNFLYTYVIQEAGEWPLNTPLYSIRCTYFLFHVNCINGLYTGVRFPLPELTARVDGCQKNAPEFLGRQLGPLTRAVNSGSGNRPLLSYRSDYIFLITKGYEKFS